MIAATGGERPHLPALRRVRRVSTTVPEQLVSQVSGVLGARLLIGCRRTGIGTGTVTRSDDPPPPITLDEQRKYLTDEVMTEYYLPTRVEYLKRLPRNGNSKVPKELLRRWLVGKASLTSE